MPTSFPSYRKRAGRDALHALVTLTDALLKKRRDYWLGDYNTPANREKYLHIITAWEANSRRLPPTTDASEATSPTVAEVITVNEVFAAFWRWAEQIHDRQRLCVFRQSLRITKSLFGLTPALEFGPNALRLVREQMILGDPAADPPRKPWARKTVNQHVHEIRYIFKWAVSRELIPARVYERLRTVEALRRGRSAARETEPVKPVPLEQVEAVRPYLNRQMNALITLQLTTGARAGELFTLRPIDIQIHEDTQIWSIVLNEHKTAHLGKRRTLYLGPRAQETVRPFLADRPLDTFLFSPREAEEERHHRNHTQRKTPLSCGNRPGTNRTKNPIRHPGDHYTSGSYRRAIQRACDLAFPPPEPLAPHKGETKKACLERLTPKQRDELKTWQKEHRWHPHQLRQTAATIIRREHGLEAAQLALGHSSALVTDAIYAERDASKVIEIMQKFG